MNRSDSRGLQDEGKEGVREGLGRRGGWEGRWDYIQNKSRMLQRGWRPTSALQAAAISHAVVVWGIWSLVVGWEESVFIPFSHPTGLGSRTSKAAHSGGSWYVLSWEVWALREAQDGLEGIALHFLSGACLSATTEHAAFPMCQC